MSMCCEVLCQFPNTLGGLAPRWGFVVQARWRWAARLAVVFMAGAFAAVFALMFASGPAAVSAAGPAGDATKPTDDPCAAYKLDWTARLPWSHVVSLADVPGETPAAKLAAAIADVRAKNPAGGVVYFPAGVYHFTEDLAIPDGIILRGAKPDVAAAVADDFAPPSRLEFPAYKPTFTGQGTPVDTAFKAIVLTHPAGDSNCGLVHLAINRAHVLFEDAKQPPQAAVKGGAAITAVEAGTNRLVVGCRLTNTAFPDPAVPDATIGQHPWQRYTWRFGAAIDVKTAANALVANNRIPPSGDDNFTFPEYVLTGRRRGETVSLVGKVVFDYDNRPGIAVNDYAIGGAGGSGGDGTPQSHPWGFRTGVVVADNFIYCSGRCAITFTADGTLCARNVIRFPAGLRRYTATGRSLVGGSSTNDNRAVQMRGWRWTLESNDYIVHSNLAADTAYRINDGEGLMHEDHVNSTIRDSRLINNRGNAYISLYKTGGIDGLEVVGNDIRTPGGIPAIFIDADRNASRHPIANVRVEANITAGSGIKVSGSPASNVVVRGNRHLGDKPAKLINWANADCQANTGYELDTKGPEAPKPPATKRQAQPQTPAPKPDGLQQP